MSPEQILESEASHSSDIYALGVMAYEMLTGVRPFAVDTSSYSWVKELPDMQRAGVRRKPKDSRPDLPGEAQEEILKALSYNPKDRHQTAFEFGESLHRALTNVDYLEPSKIDLATLRVDITNQPYKLSSVGAEPVSRAVESFERLWSNATFTDRIRPLSPESAKEERTQQTQRMMHNGKRGMGAKPKKAQYAYRLGDELCLAFDIGGKPNVRGLGAKPKHDGYLTLLDKGADGIVYCLCPSLFAPNTRLDSGRIYLPQEGSPYPAFELSGAAGKEKLLAIISDEPLGLDWLSNDAETPARILSSNDIESLFARLQQLGEGRWTALSSYFEVVA